MYTVCQTHHLCRLSVTAHKADAGYVTAITLQQAVQHGIIKRITNILLKLGAVTAMATVRTLGEVKR